METYKLGADEVVIFKNKCKVFDIPLDNKPQNKDGVMLLTNQHLVFSYQIDNDSFCSLAFPLGAVKMYKGEPQIKFEGVFSNRIDIYFVDVDFSVEFPNKIIGGKFVAESKKLLTGKSAFDVSLNALKSALTNVKRTITTIDDTLEIDSVQLATSIAVATSPSNTVKGVASAIAGVFSSRKQHKPTAQQIPDNDDDE